jgi:hypothetical protein
VVKTPAQLSGPFTFVLPRVRPGEGSGTLVELRYRMGEGSGAIAFTEVVDLPFELPDSPAVRSALRTLELVAGVSYYKCVAPVPLVVPPLGEAERALVTALYDEGLREFAYRNGFAVPLPVALVETAHGPAEAGAASCPEPDAFVDPVAPPAGGAADRPRRALVPIGGGKDSALVAALVPDGALVAVKPVGAHEHLAEALGRPLIGVGRTLDPQLRELVEQGAPNGHVPVTAITSAISVLVAAALGYDDVLMGIERSADEPTVITADGVPVNHQFSKSRAAERLLAAVFEPTGVRYLSLLRPLTELAIGAAVARRGLADDIVSCNRVFTIWNANTSSQEQRPCGECAKCLFTALMLAPGSTPEQVAARYGRPLLDTADHVGPVRDLWSEEKPFDCVGERLETAAAVALLADAPAWRDQVVVSALADEARGMLRAAGVAPADLLHLGDLDVLPEDYRDTLAGLVPDLDAVAAELTDAAR